MNDMSMVPYAEAKADRVTADDLIGGPRTITITKVTGAVEEGKNQAILNFDGDEGKPFKPCKTMVRVMIAVWGEYASAWVGRSLTLYRDPTVTFGALATGGVRISHMSHMESAITVVVATKKGKKGPIKVMPLDAHRPAQAQQAGTDKAAEWANVQIAAFAAAQTMAEHAEAERKGDKAMARLKTERPELFQAIIEASSAALNRINPPQDDPFGLPPIEGRGESRNDTHAEHPARAVADRIIAEAATVATVIDLASLENREADSIEAMPDEMAGEVMNAIALRRGELKAKPATE